MLQPLIVNSNVEFASRMQTESNSKALVTTSYIQGLRWLSDPSIPISGIYLNPNDSSYSAIRFLAIALLQRPATPTFILDEEGGMTQQNFDCLSDKFKIQKTFKGETHFQDLVQGLQMQVPQELESLNIRPNVQSGYAGYIAVPVVDFIHSRNYPFNVFVEDEKKELRFFAMEGSEVDLDYLTFLAKKTSCLFVEETSIQTRKESFQLVEQAYLDPDYLSPSWRSAETLFRTKALLTELQKNGVSEDILTTTYTTIENLFQLVGQLSKDAYLRKFVDQAKQCDRTVACATFSTLMCKKLKFESSSVAESLGLASFFQDVSLYNSPFGNLAAIHPEDLSQNAELYYFNHPDLSARMVGKATSVPEVTRQIIRQHHERPDHTGFPHKVGHPQLQPLAEILSLINSYLDYRGPADGIEAAVFSHYSGTIATAFKELLVALGK
ncbi:MAG: hypothetical protein JST80_13340 [Bdellovibrionales bacterium]|nr:hypothetical protein [Bdellovibrionales bacterium]